MEDVNAIYCYHEAYVEDSWESWIVDNVCEIACDMLNHDRLLIEDNRFFNPILCRSK